MEDELNKQQANAVTETDKDGGANDQAKEVRGVSVGSDGTIIGDNRHSKQQRGKKAPRRRQRQVRDSEYIERVVAINRVSKVVRGGKNFSFAAIVVVGDGKGKVGFAIGKAKEVSDAIQKGLSHAKSKFMPIPMDDTTIPHEVMARFSAAKVFMKPAAKGTGVIAGGAVRAVCECVGIKDILTKSLGSQTPINVVQATIHGLAGLTAKNLN